MRQDGSNQKDHSDTEVMHGQYVVLEASAARGNEHE